MIAYKRSMFNNLLIDKMYKQIRLLKKMKERAYNIQKREQEKQILEIIKESLNEIQFLLWFSKANIIISNSNIYCILGSEFKARTVKSALNETVEIATKHVMKESYNIYYAYIDENGSPKIV